MLTVTPEQLAAYLAVLPKGALQVVLKAGDFSLSLNLAQATPEAAGASPGAQEEGPVDKDGNRIPEEVAALYPQLVRRAG